MIKREILIVFVLFLLLLNAQWTIAQNENQFNGCGENEYIGISNPDMNAVAAKEHAVCNAVLNYIFSKAEGELETQVSGSAAFNNTNTYRKIMYIEERVAIDGFACDIMDVSDSTNNGCFVKCRISKRGGVSDNSILLKRATYINIDNDSVGWNIRLKFTCRINGDMYVMEFYDCSEYSSMSLLSGYAYNLSEKEHCPFGFLQTLIYAYAPLAPAEIDNMDNNVNKGVYKGTYNPFIVDYCNNSFLIVEEGLFERERTVRSNIIIGEADSRLPLVLGKHIAFWDLWMEIAQSKKKFDKIIPIWNFPVQSHISPYQESNRIAIMPVLNLRDCR